MTGEYLLAVLLAVTVRVDCAEEQLQLELASVIFRHGDRSPVGTFPNDLHEEDDWPQGYGQLSVEGMRQQYYLGTILKERYITDRYQGFLSENYTRVEVYVRSTDYDRTLMSAESQLAGLFPPEGDQIFNPSIPWQPIPVHTVPQGSDGLFGRSGCLRYTDLLAADKDSAIYKNVQMDNKDFFDKVAKCTGLEMANLTNIWLIEDTLYVEKVSGYERPSCLDDSDLTRMTNLSAFTLSLRYNTHEKQRITAGNWTQKVLGDMKGKAFGDEAYNDSKLYLYSAHDTTVACMMSAMGVWDYQLPGYAAAFFIELLSNKTTGEYFVEMYHRANFSSDDITLLTIPGCGNETRCTLEQFETFATALIPDDWQEECGLESGSDCDGSDSGGGVIVIILGALLALVILLWIVTCILLLCVYRRLRKLLRYAKLQTVVGAENDEL